MMHFKELMLEDGRQINTCIQFISEGSSPSFKLTIFLDDVIHETTLDSSQIDSMAKQVGMNQENFKEEIQNAFVKTNATDFIFSLEESKKNKVLNWKKFMDSEDLKVNLGSFQMKKMQVPLTLFSTITNMLQTIQSYKKQMDENCQSLKEANDELKTANEELSKLANIKTALEADLFSKFSMVLNEKKSKIVQLKKQITHMKDNTVKKSKDAQYDHGQSTDDDGEAAASTSSLNLTDNLSFADADSDSELVIPPKSKKLKSTEQPSKSKFVKLKSKKTVVPMPSSKKQAADTCDASDLFNDL